MIGWKTRVAAVALAAVAHTNTVKAQTTDSLKTMHRPSTTLRVAKWSTLALTTGAAAYGFSANRMADADYASLEQSCQDQRLVCARRTGAAYADADLERRYQNVLSMDNRARTALIASQVGVAATVVMFVIDLRHNRPPKDIPYKPRALELMPRSDGGLQLRLTLPLPVDQRKH